MYSCALNMHKKVREVARLYNKKTTNILVDSSGKAVIDEREILEIWTKYITELFKNDRPNIQQGNVDQDEGPEILESEVLHALQSAKGKKATGPDNIPTELLQMIHEDHISVLVKFFNNVYVTGEMPEEWLKSVFIILLKKQRGKRCDE